MLSDVTTIPITKTVSHSQQWRRDLKKEQTAGAGPSSHYGKSHPPQSVFHSMFHRQVNLREHSGNTVKNQYNSQHPVLLDNVCS